VVTSTQPAPAREADAGAPPGARAFKRQRTVALVVAEHLTPQLREGVSYVTSVGFPVPVIVKMVETTWEVPDARWACIVRELCPTDKVSLGWARHRVRPGGGGGGQRRHTRRGGSEWCACRLCKK
jgi:hypothetical protein